MPADLELLRRHQQDWETRMKTGCRLLFLSLLALGCSQAQPPPEKTSSLRPTEPVNQQIPASADATIPSSLREVQLRLTLPETVPVKEPYLLIADFTLHNGSEFPIIFDQDGEGHRETFIRVWDAAQRRVPTALFASYYMREERSYETSGGIRPHRIEPGEGLCWQIDVSRCYSLAEGEYTLQAAVAISAEDTEKSFGRKIESEIVGFQVVR